jgi:DNA ligase-1
VTAPGGFARFVALVDDLDHAATASAKHAALEVYCRAASPDDLAWALFFLTGRRLRRLVSARDLRAWAAVHTGLPPWLVEESYHAVGDFAETLALLCARQPIGTDASGDRSLAGFVEQRLAPLATMPAVEQHAEILSWWESLDERSCLVAHKLVTGTFRAGLPVSEVVRAVAAVAGREPAVIEHRLQGDWQPDAAFTTRLLAVEDARDDPGRPYPFCLVTPLDDQPESLGARADWLAEWQWSGLRVQLIVRSGTVFLWSRGDELIGDRFPEIMAAARALPDGTVLDGALVGWRDGRAAPITLLERRLHRRTVTRKLVREAPVALLAFDVLEHRHADCRRQPLHERRSLLVGLLRDDAGLIRASPLLEAADWNELRALRSTARQHAVEGLVLKQRNSPYQAGSARGDWWAWKLVPYTIDAVLVYAQPGRGRRAALHTDFTLAVRDGDALVPVAKAEAGLTEAEIARLDAWIRTHTVERYGPVRGVEPRHVFELGFDGIEGSARHKAGLVVRLPRLLRWRADLQPADATSLDALRDLIPPPATRNSAPSAATAEVPPSLFDPARDG